MNTAIHATAPARNIMAALAFLLAAALFSFPNTAHAGCNLEPGVYSVPVEAMKANDHAATSAAASAFANTGRLSVASSGVATLTVDISPVTVFGIVGYASDFKVYQGDIYIDGKHQTGVETVDAVVLETTVNEKGAEVPTRISFAIPDSDADGVYLSMYVDAMNGSPDAWLRIDYGKAVLEGSPIVYSGTAHVEQFGEYDVQVRTSVLGGIIQGLEIEGSNFAGAYGVVNQARFDEAAEGMRHKWDGMWIGHGHSNAEALFKAGGQELDTVSGATYTSKAIRDALMDSLSISWDDEAITVPSKLAAGTYTVPVSYYTDVVLHQLAGGAKAPGTLVVGKDGSMQLDLDLENGTAREPLYTMAVNGYYAGNDASAALSTRGMKVDTGTVRYSDAYFPAGTSVVTHLSVPLVGGFAREYATQAYLYVPVMNALVGEQNGIDFDHGRFLVNAYLKIHWDDAVLLKAAADEKPAAKAQKLSCKASISKAMGAKPFALGVKSDAKGAKLSYKTSNKKVATVSASGKVTLKGAGTCKVTVTSTAKGYAKATKAVTVKATLAKASLTKATKSSKKGKLAVAWKKVAGAQGYQVKVAVGKKAKTYTVKGAKTLKKAVKAAAGKKAKVQVRAWSKASGKMVYGKWSAAKTVKVKK